MTDEDIARWYRRYAAGVRWDPYHEAGHAIVGEVLAPGLIKSVNIFPDIDNDRAGWCAYHRDITCDRGRYAVIAVAGVVAVSEASGAPVSRGGQPDYWDIPAAAIEPAETLARRILLLYWDRVVAVAEALDQESVLSGERVRALMRPEDSPHEGNNEPHEAPDKRTAAP